MTKPTSYFVALIDNHGLTLNQIRYNCVSIENSTLEKLYTWCVEFLTMCYARPMCYARLFAQDLKFAPDRNRFVDVCR